MSKSPIGQIFIRHPIKASIASGVLLSALGAWAIASVHNYYVEKDFGDVVSCDLGSEGDVTPAVSFRGTGPHGCESLVKTMERAAEDFRLNGSQINGGVSRVRMHTANGGQRIVYVGPDGVLKAPPGMR